MAIAVFSFAEFQARAPQCFAAERPFVVRGLPLPENLYQTTLSVFQASRLNLFNLLNHKAQRTYSELLEAIAALHEVAAATPDPLSLWQTYGTRFAQYVLRSDQLNPHQDFNLQLDVLPGTPLSGSVVFPATRSYSDSLRPLWPRHYLNTVINISATRQPLLNQKQNIHGHNYDTFSILAQAEGQSCVYFFPPEAYLRFQTRLVAARPGILLLIPSQLQPAVFAEAESCQSLQSGDLVYTPPLWFHCFEHAGSYLNIANGEFFPTAFARRLAEIQPERFGGDCETLRWHARQLLHYQP